jgi:hypothetical protein
VSVSRIVRIGTSGVLAAWGAALLVSPSAVARAVAGRTQAPPEPVVRVLGARRIVQHLLVAGTTSRVVAWGSVGTDVLHAGSMIAAARIWPEYRRAELTSAGIAVLAATLTARTASPG